MNPLPNRQISKYLNTLLYDDLGELVLSDCFSSVFEKAKLFTLLTTYTLVKWLSVDFDISYDNTSNLRK